MMFTVKITHKKKIICSIKELVRKFNSELRKFFIHVYRTHHQYEAVDQLAKNLTPEKAHIIIDWSQNWEGKYFKEVHAAHFGGSKTQVSLHTGVFFYLDTNGKRQMQSFCTVSDDLRHDACAIHAHLKPVMQKLKETVLNLKEISVQSDGPTPQYRNKTNFCLFNHSCIESMLEKASWHFTAPGHSKSRGDAVGGNFKEFLKRCVCNGDDILRADDIIEALKKKQTRIDVFKINLDDIEVVDKIVSDKQLTTVPQTMKISQVVWVKSKKNELTFRYLSCNVCGLDETCKHFDMPKSKISYEKFMNELDANLDLTPTNCDEEQLISSLQPLKVSDFDVGDWVVVIFFGGKWYPGVIKERSSRKLLVQFTERELKTIWWPVEVYQQRLFSNQILRKIKPLTEIKNAQGELFLSMDDQEYDFIESYAANCVRDE